MVVLREQAQAVGRIWGFAQIHELAMAAVERSRWKFKWRSVAARVEESQHDEQGNRTKASGEIRKASKV